MISTDVLRDLFSYEPDTGAFRWRTDMWCGNNRSILKHRVGDLAGSARGHVYVRLCFRHNGQSHKVYAHRLAWLFVHGAWPAQHTDHINGDKTDNRISNLRVATASQNQQNRKCARHDSGAGMLGVAFDARSGRYSASIRLNKRTRYLGSYATPEEAHAAYLAAKRVLHPYSMIHCEEERERIRAQRQAGK